MDIDSKGWLLECHVRPIDDWVEHEYSIECVCGPKVEDYTEDDGGLVIIHNSLDGREWYEEDNELFNQEQITDED